MQPLPAKYVEIGISCAPLRRRFDIDIREFMVLAIIYESGEANAQSLQSVLELSSSTIDYCLCRLADNELISVSTGLVEVLRASSDGLKLVREACRSLARHVAAVSDERIALECAA